MLRIKSGVEMVNISPQITLAIQIAHSVYSQFNTDCVITSLTDGKHRENSLHYKGLAVDLRTRNIQKDQKIPLINTLRSEIGENYDVVLEKTHVHIEYDPK